MITDPWFFVLAVPAVMLAGISKGGFGGGLGLLAVPLMALTISPIQAAAIMLPILCVMDLFGVWAYRGRYDRTNMRILIPASLIGIAIGTLSFQFLNVAAIRLIIGGIAVGFTLRYVLATRGSKPEARGPSVARGTLWGAVSGFTTFVSHAGGPPLNVYLLPQRMDKTLYVGTTVFFYIFVNYVKLVPYTWLGLFTGQNFYTSLALLPLAPLGMGLGIWLHRRVPETLFYRLCYLFLFATGLKLLYDGVSGLI